MGWTGALCTTVFAFNGTSVHSISNKNNALTLCATLRAPVDRRVLDEDQAIDFVRGEDLLHPGWDGDDFEEDADRRGTRLLRQVYLSFNVCDR